MPAKMSPDNNSVMSHAAHLTTDQADAGETKILITPPINLGFPDDWEANKSQTCCGMHVTAADSTSLSHIYTNMFGLAVGRLH